MYAYLDGQLSYKSPTLVHLDINGVGYLVNISLHTYSKIEALEKVKLYTHLHVKEDSQTLFGFFDADEKELFILLLSVSGIGPNTARIILSSMAPIEVKTAILTENDLAFKKVKGVGPKTAKRVILDLKDKIKQGDAIRFQKAKVQKVLGQIPGTDNSVESVIKTALQKLT